MPDGLNCHRVSAAVLVIAIALSFACNGAGPAETASCPAPIVVSLPDNASGEALADVDIFSVSTAQEVLGETGLASMLALMLSSLHYDVRLDDVSAPSTDAHLCQAWREFESTADLKTDGTVTFSELGRLGELVDKLSAKSVTLPFKFFHDAGDSAFITGTWVMQGDQIATPLNTNEIRCNRSSCTERSVQLSGGSILMMDSRELQVTRWTNEEIEATAGTPCRIVRFLINRRTQQVSEIATDRTTEGCTIIGALGKPRVSTLEDGFRVSRDHETARRDEAVSAMSRQARDIIKRVTQPSETPPTTGRE